MLSAVPALEVRGGVGEDPEVLRYACPTLDRFREFSEPLVELPVKRRDEGDSQGAADTRDEVQPGSDCPFSDLPASDSFVGDR